MLAVCLVAFAPRALAQPLSPDDAAAVLAASDLSEGEMEVLREMVASGITAEDLRIALEARDLSDAELELLRERFRSHIGVGHLIGIGMAAFVIGLLAGMAVRRLEAVPA